MKKVHIYIECKSHKIVVFLATDGEVAERLKAAVC